MNEETPFVPRGAVAFFVAMIGFYIAAMLTGREVAFKRINVWIPYLWAAGIMVFSTGLFYGGVAGEPRRTNLGLSYANPASPLYRPDWAFSRIFGAIGGTIMVTAMILYFIVFFGTLLKKKTTAPFLELPTSEPYHDEDVASVQSLRPWIVAAVILLVIAYAMPFVELARGKYEGAPPYRPGSPVAQTR